MEAMEDCRVEIVTQTEGRRTRFSARGLLSRGTPSTVTYAGEDGETVLTVCKEFLGMRRTGETASEARFCVGEEGQFRLTALGKTAALPLVTERYRAVFRKDGIFLHLVYKLFYPSPQIFSLKIAIRIISEEE